MKKLLFVFVFITLYTLANAQDIKRIKADSVLIFNDSLEAELIITNSTKDSSGFLYNTGNGRTRFRKMISKITDSSIQFTGTDSLSIARQGKASGISGSLQYLSDNTIYGTDSSLHWNDSLKTLQLGDTLTVSDLGITGNHLDSTYAEVSGISLINNTPASGGAQQRSPAARFGGFGVNAANVSRPVEINNYLLPLQDDTGTSFQLVWEYQRNNAIPRTRFLLMGPGVSPLGGGLSFINTAPTQTGEIMGSDQVNINLSGAPGINTYALTSATYPSLTTERSRFLLLDNGPSGFYPSSGNASHDLLSIEPKINQTGTANGVTRGLHVNVIVTAAADFRAIEVSEGKSFLRSAYLTKPGDKMNIATGTDASTGTATLTSGTITVNTSAVSADSKIFLTYITPSGTTGALSAPSGSISTGTSFVINSSSASDNSTVYYWIIN